MDISELRQLTRKLRRLSVTDDLTGLNNYRFFHERLKYEYLRAVRYAQQLGCIMVDIDYFKSVNDTHGHTVGDAVLRQFATLLRSNVRQVDQVGRLGGEEFLIVLPETSQQRACEAAEILRNRINRHVFDTVEHKTASFGVTQFREDETLRSMLDRVDQALYAAKDNGRDRVEVA